MLCQFDRERISLARWREDQSMHRSRGRRLWANDVRLCLAPTCSIAMWLIGMIAALPLSAAQDEPAAKAAAETAAGRPRRGGAASGRGRDSHLVQTRTGEGQEAGRQGGTGREVAGHGRRKRSRRRTLCAVGRSAARWPSPLRARPWSCRRFRPRRNLSPSIGWRRLLPPWMNVEAKIGRSRPARSWWRKSHRSWTRRPRQDNSN